MKTLIRTLTLAAVATLFALPALAQETPAAAGPCDEAAKGELYTQYYNEKKADQAKAFETAKQYLAKYGACADNYTASVKKFHDAYNAALNKTTLRTDFFKAFNAKDARKSDELAKQLLVNDPNDVKVALLATSVGYAAVLPKGSAANDPALTASTLDYAARSIQLLEAGKQALGADLKTVEWAPFTGKDDALGWMNYYIGALKFRSNPDEAVSYLVKVAQSSSSAKQEPTTYTILAAVYQKEYEKLNAQYKTFTEENDQSRLVAANMALVVDRLTDAYARAVAYSKPDAPGRAEWMTILTELYKSKHNNTTEGLDAYIAGVKNAPLLITQPLTTLPTPAPGTTGGDGAATTGTTTTGATAPAGAPVAAPAKPVATTTTTTTTAKPAPATQKPAAAPAKKKP
jgi:hypothetical protein